MLYIGIDPDVKLSGVALWDSKDHKFLKITKLRFFDLLEFIDSCQPSIVILEAGKLIKKANWHSPNSSKSAGERIALRVGSNHQTETFIKEYCLKKGYTVREVKPKGKIKAEQFQKLTNYKKRINQDQRDAAMLVFGY